MGRLIKERSPTTMVVVAVVGCGALGSRVAGELAICGHRVPDIIRESHHRCKIALAIIKQFSKSKIKS